MRPEQSIRVVKNKKIPKKPKFRNILQNIPCLQYLLDKMPINLSILSYGMFQEFATVLTKAGNYETVCMK